MAFVSLYEVRSKKMSRRGHRIGVDLLGYAVHNYKGRKHITFTFTHKLLVKANLKAGDYLDVCFEPTTGEVLIERVLTGGWKLYTATKTSKSGTARIQVPYFEEYKFPEVPNTTEISSIHLSTRGIIFNIKQLNDKK